jgi:hypothetical protein
MAKFFAESKRRNIYCVAAVCAVVAGCATPKGELPSYELPSRDGASVQLATIEGSLTPGYYRPVCAYVFAVDGRTVGERADCTAAIPILPGKHTIVAWVDGYLLDGPARLRRATTTLTFDAAEGHQYKISVARVGVSGIGVRADVWISDETTQASATEAKLVTSPQRNR